MLARPCESKQAGLFSLLDGMTISAQFICDITQKRAHVETRCGRNNNKTKLYIIRNTNFTQWNHIGTVRRNNMYGWCVFCFVLFFEGFN